MRLRVDLSTTTSGVATNAQAIRDLTTALGEYIRAQEARDERQWQQMREMEKK